MKRLIKLVCTLLIVTMMLLPYTARAGIIGTDRAYAGALDASNRDRVASFVSRADVAQQLAAVGIAPGIAQERVNAMTQEEINSIAGKIDALPAGGVAHAWWLAILAIVVGGVIWIVWWTH